MGAWDRHLDPDALLAIASGATDARTGRAIAALASLLLYWTPDVIAWFMRAAAKPVSSALSQTIRTTAVRSPVQVFG